MGDFVTGVSILTFRASQEEMSSRTTLKSFTRAALDTVELDNVEIDLLRSPRSFENVLIRCGFRMMILINAQFRKNPANIRLDEDVLKTLTFSQEKLHPRCLTSLKIGFWLRVLHIDLTFVPDLQMKPKK